MAAPFIYQVKPHQVKNEDVSYFLRNAIAKQFEGRDYMIATEQTIEQPTVYSLKPRRLRVFGINEPDGTRHTIYFDITEVTDGFKIDW